MCAKKSTLSVSLNRTMNMCQHIVKTNYISPHTLLRSPRELWCPYGLSQSMSRVQGKHA